MTESVVLENLQIKDKLEGVVKRIGLAGAVIDIGADQDVLLHISQIKTGRINNVQDALKENQDVTVWVHNIDKKTGRVDVTMIEPAAVTWQEIKVGSVYKGEVVRIEKFGVFVDIGAERPGLVHISELANEYVQKAEDVVQQGEEVEVQIIGVNRRKRQIDLSIKALDTTEVFEEADESEGEEEAPTALAVALQRAMSETDETTETLGKKSRKLRNNEEQDEIVRRTLQQHQSSE